MTDIFEYNPSIDFKKHIFWQYNNAPAINSLVNSKQNWINENQVVFWQDWVGNVLNIATANDFGLAIWGALLGIPRNYIVNGTNTALSREQYRKVILARLKLIHMRGTVPEINALLKFLFSDYGKAYVIDNYNMTLTYRFNFNLSPLQIAVLQTVTLLPRPAGVQITIITLDNKVFGFDGSGEPFDQARFANYLNM